MKIPYILLLPLLILGNPLLHAQNAVPGKSETKLYLKTKAKPSIKAFDKFLSTFPTSVYAEEISSLKDSTIYYNSVDLRDAIQLESFIENHPDSRMTPRAQLQLEKLNTPTIPEEKAMQDAAVLSGKTENISAVLYRDKNLNRLCIVDFMPQDKPFDMIGISFYSEKDGEWALEMQQEIDKYIMEEGSDRTIEAGKAEIVKVGKQRMIFFSYINYCSSAPRNVEYASTLLSLDGTQSTSSIFYGVNLSKKTPAKEDYAIEGRSPETLAQGGLSPMQLFLLQDMTRNSHLTQISEEDALSDDAIQWWLNKNPKAMTSATSLNFGNLAPECSMIKAYAKATKENSAQYSCAIIDFRGYTMIVSYSKGAKNHSLVWAEPECINRETDRFLSDIYFESNGTTLVLFYYKGKTTFKYRINLASKTLKK